MRVCVCMNVGGRWCHKKNTAPKLSKYLFIPFLLASSFTAYSEMSGMSGDHGSCSTSVALLLLSAAGGEKMSKNDGCKERKRKRR